MELIHYLIDAPIALITLAIMILFKLRPPRKINSWYGYRTTNSMKSQKHWDLAQRLSADSGIYHMGILVAIQVVSFWVLGEAVFTRTLLLVFWVFSFVMIITGVEKKLKQVE